ncbi:hypothetical protein Zmor_016650 [Zophobas morio]|uniref:Uncharacterized protein n=1 Tax=Zophobas morio TaxID=2755281 RepID=A0AA38I7V4_9CUCU|nr:hypothetical protein Zmor_016650 [Zophobas morio]
MCFFPPAVRLLINGSNRAICVSHVNCGGLLTFGMICKLQLDSEEERPGTRRVPLNDSCPIDCALHSISPTKTTAEEKPESRTVPARRRNARYGIRNMCNELMNNDRLFNYAHANFILRTLFL